MHTFNWIRHPHITSIVYCLMNIISYRYIIIWNNTVFLICVTKSKYSIHKVQEEFEDTEGVIILRKSKMDRKYIGQKIDWLIDWLIVINATFSNNSAILWRLVLVVEECQERTTDHVQATGTLYHLWMRVECTLYFWGNLQSRARTHAVLGIGLYDLLGNPTT
jgi:hypothetical protein